MWTWEQWWALSRQLEDDEPPAKAARVRKERTEGCRWITEQAAVILVRARGLRARIIGGDRSGLTRPCRGCSDQSVHDGHLARGALTYLGRRGKS